MSRVLLLCLSIFFHLNALNPANAQTTGGVNWLDPLQYTKPQFIPLTVPDEATCPNKYYVDHVNGSGSTCSQASPCKTVQTVCGKTGTTGGPAYIYVKGNTNNFTINGTCYGSAGNEIVIKPWPTDTTSVYTFTGTASSTWNIIGVWDGGTTTVHHIIIDGGPNLQFEWINLGSDYNNSTALVIGASNITIARTRIRFPSAPGAGISPCTTYSKDWVCDSVKIINNEFYDGMHQAQGSVNEQNYGIYAGNLGPCGANIGQITNLYIQNNIFHNLGSLGIQVEPRKSTNGAYISGNAFHDLGMLSCGSQWNCRPAISIADSCGANNTNINIYNNLMWNIADACIWAFGTTGYVYNNTCYNYAQGTSGGNGIQFNDFVAGYGGSLGGVTVENNIAYKSGGGWLNGTPKAQSNNICASGCPITWNSNTVLSTDQTSSNFLKIGPNSNAVNQGVNVGILTAYNGASRLNLNGAYDIGAFAYRLDNEPEPPFIQNIQ